MREAQRLAALPSARVLDGATLPAALATFAPAERDAQGRRRALVQELAYGTLRHWGTLDALVRALATKPIADPALALPRRRRALSARPHARAAVRRRRPRGERGGGVDASRRQGARQCAAAPLPARARRAERRGARGSGRALVASALVDRPRAARIPGRLGGDPRGGQRAPAARAARQPPRRHARGAAVGVRRRRPRRDAGGRRRDHRRAAAVRARDAGFRRGRVLGAGPRARSSRRRCCRLCPGSACSTPAPRPAARPRTSSSSPTSSSSRSTATPSAWRACARTSRGCTSADAQVRVVAGDAGAPAQWWDGRPFDRILADVPCTASGRRAPPSRRQVAAARSRRRQLRARSRRGSSTRCGRASRPGGLLLYATCSVFAAENEAQVDGIRRAAPRRVARNPHLPARGGASRRATLAFAPRREPQSGRIFLRAAPQALRGWPAARIAPAPTPTDPRPRVRRPARRHAPSASLLLSPARPGAVGPLRMRGASCGRLGWRCTWLVGVAALLGSPVRAVPAAHADTIAVKSAELRAEEDALRAQRRIRARAQPDARGGAAEGRAALLRARVRARCGRAGTGSTRRC